MSLKTDEKAKQVFREVTRLREAKQYEAASELLLELLGGYPDSPAILGTLGAVAYEADKLDVARGYFARVVALSPHSELASLGLFHSFWDLGEQDAAKAEVARFVAANSPEEYELLMSEMGWKVDPTTGQIVTR